MPSVSSHLLSLKHAYPFSQDSHVSSHRLSRIRPPIVISLQILTFYFYVSRYVLSNLSVDGLHSHLCL